MKKIMQIALCGSYNPKLGYQDNILPKYYVKLGFECITIAQQYYKDEGIIKRDQIFSKEISDNNKLIRLPNQFGLSYKNNRFLRRYEGLYKVLESEKPDIIFLHNFQFQSIIDVVKYCKKNKSVRVYADSHTDYINSGSNWVSLNILHKIIWRYYVKKIEKYVIKFWGVTEQRCKFMSEVYRISSDKIDLLVMGADDEKIDFENSEAIRNKIRKSLSIKNEDFVIITGGKIDQAKNIHNLLEVIDTINNKEIKLIIFGSINTDMKSLIEPKLNNNNIKYIGWIDSDKVYDYFLAADLGVFPGTHSVLWEQAVGTGLPCVFKYWNGMDHVDVGGNCDFIYDSSVETIRNKILELFMDKNKYNEMLKIAVKEGRSKFSYLDIAKRSIEFKE